jgi:hypothetical protein
VRRYRIIGLGVREPISFDCDVCKKENLNPQTEGNIIVSPHRPRQMDLCDDCYWKIITFIGTIQK